jgi:flagellar biosynthetic protein FliR
MTNETLLILFLAFVRISGVLLSAPFFGQQGIPVKVRILLAVAIAYGMFGLVPGLPASAFTAIGFVVAVVIEAITGIVIGFSAHVVFWGIQLGTEILGFQMGLSMAQAYNPVDGSKANPVNKIIGLLFLMLYILLDGPHHLMRALALSLLVVPMGGGLVHASGPLLIQWVMDMFHIALRIAAPFMVSLFLVDLALAVYTRSTPQANLFALSFLIKIGAGLGLLILIVPQLVPLAPEFVSTTATNLLTMVRALAGR